jgi:ABC-2 type transport system ATP-binding protein
VCKTYRFFTLDDVDLDLPAGHIMGFIGPNGAGKSTTIRILLGLIHQDRGDVRVLGYRMPSEQVAAKWDIGFASEDMRLYESMTLGWHMRFIASIYPAWDSAYAETLLKHFGLVPEQKVRGLSHGQRVKAGLLLVLARRPRLLVLDEPTTGLDPQEIREVRRLVSRLSERGTTILLSSHLLAEVEATCTHLVVMDRGRLISAGSVSELVGASDRSVFLEVDDTDAARKVLESMPKVLGIHPETTGLTVELDGLDRAELVAALVRGGVGVRTVAARRQLEDAFLQIVGEEHAR